jgi:peptidoglycan hydrolase-like protein with peptidoglycan-binding domain
MNSSVASSQPTVLPTVLGATASCVDIPRNMHRGAESSFVTTLQKFLQSKGLLTEITGFYGDKTIEAVKDYQGSKGLPVTGMVYDATRESIKGETCQ